MDLLRSVTVASYLPSKASNNVLAFFYLSFLLKHAMKFIHSRDWCLGFFSICFKKNILLDQC